MGRARRPHATDRDAVSPHTLAGWPVLPGSAEEASGSGVPTQRALKTLREARAELAHLRDLLGRREGPLGRM
jgi:hypothetical protein